MQCECYYRCNRLWFGLIYVCMTVYLSVCLSVCLCAKSAQYNSKSSRWISMELGVLVDIILLFLVRNDYLLDSPGLWEGIFQREKYDQKFYPGRGSGATKFGTIAFQFQRKF